MKKYFIGTVLISIVIFICYKISIVNYNDNIPVNKVSILPLKNHSYFILLDSLKKKDEISSNQQANQEYISVVWTTELQKKIDSKFTQYNPDSIIMLIQWAEKFKTYGEVDQNKSTLCNVIYTHWLNYCVNKMNQYYEENSGIKNDYKFKYIVSRCSEQQYYIAIGNTHLEKVIENITKANFSYLFNRFWIGSSVFIKTIVFGFIALFVFMISICIKFIKKLN